MNAVKKTVVIIQNYIIFSLGCSCDIQYSTRSFSSIFELHGVFKSDTFPINPKRFYSGTRKCPACSNKYAREFIAKKKSNKNPTLVL